MEGQHLGGVHNGAAADGDHALDALGKVGADLIHHGSGGFTLGIGLQKGGAAAQPQGLDVLLIEEFVGHDEIILRDGFVFHKFLEGVRKDQIGMHFEL